MPHVNSESGMVRLSAMNSPMVSAKGFIFFMARGSMFSLVRAATSMDLPSCSATRASSAMDASPMLRFGTLIMRFRAISSKGLYIRRRYAIMSFISMRS